MKTIPSSVFAPLAFDHWDHPNQSTFCASDLTDPWCSVYGFPLLAAQLAANQKLLLLCREDEVFELLAKLNILLACPTALNRTYKMGQQLEQAVQNKIERLLERQKQVIKIGSQAGESEPVTTPEKTGPGGLGQIITPGDPAHEIAGLEQMRVRLERWLPALDKVKEQGFHVVAFDRRRQPYRPALEMRRNEPVLLDGEPSALEAGFLQPIQYHLTLWAYQVVRCDKGQSTIWN